MAKLFLSYRRDDTADVAGRISDRLVQQFGKNNVFTDVDSIPLGVNFATHIDNQVSQCDIFLAAMGPDWLKHLNNRLDDPKDFVRIEIEAALKRGIPVIPLLVRGGSVPIQEKLPVSLSELAYRQGTLIRSDTGFHSDVDRLIKALKPRPHPYKGRLLAALSFLIVLSVAALVVPHFDLFDEPDIRLANTDSEIQVLERTSGPNDGTAEYMDRQEAKLRAQLEGNGVRVQREGDNIRLIMPENIAFDTGYADISSDFYPMLDSIARVLNEFEKTAIKIGGHTDSTGSALLNQNLSEQRAKAVGDYLKQQGVISGRMRTAGFGPRYPIASNSDASGRQKNRRVELELLPL